MSTEPKTPITAASARRLRMAQLYAVVLTILGAGVLIQTLVAEIVDGSFGLATGYLVGAALLGIGLMRWSDLRKLR